MGICRKNKFLFIIAIVAVTFGCHPKTWRGRSELSGHPELSALENIPPRPASAMNGTDFIERTANLSKEAREEAIYEEIRSGNIPDFLRTLKPIKLIAKDKETHLGTITATVWVMPDYLAIGSDEDFVRIPMNLVTATRLAQEFGFVLPTRKIVDAIYAQSSLHATPQPLTPGPEMTSNLYYLRHNQMINAELGAYELGQLLSGHKKDVVISKKLLDKPGRILIYGWHQPDGQPIQPLSNVHDALYADYSHGIRFVASTVSVNGIMDELTHVIARDETSQLFTYEGTTENFQEFMTSAQLAFEHRH